MKNQLENVYENKLPEGLEQADLFNAVKASGYPLQGLVAHQLKEFFGITEEWGYIDRDTGDHRALDIFAYRRLKEFEHENMHPNLITLVECKRSSMPYIFFRSVIERLVPNFPFVTGCRKIWLHDSRNHSRMEYITNCLGLPELPFVASGPAICATFSKVHRKGKELELSGIDPFNKVVLPLVKSLDYALEYYAIKNETALFPALILCVCVLDAPMVLVEGPDKMNELSLEPWVRIVRQENPKNLADSKQPKWYVVDFVHISFLEDFLVNHLLPFAESFGERIIKQENILRNGGIVNHLNDWNWNEIQVRTTKK